VLDECLNVENLGKQKLCAPGVSLFEAKKCAWSHMWDVSAFVDVSCMLTVRKEA